MAQERDHILAIFLQSARGEVMVAWTNEVAVGEVRSCQISGDILKAEQMGYPAGLMWGVRASEASGLRHRFENLERQSLHLQRWGRWRERRSSEVGKTRSLNMYTVSLRRP